MFVCVYVLVGLRVSYLLADEPWTHLVLEASWLRLTAVSAYCVEKSTLQRQSTYLDLAN